MTTAIPTQVAPPDGAAPAEGRAAALAERILGTAIAAMEAATIHLGSRLGLYRALAEHGPLTSGALAAAAGCDERYVREWLEQQAVAGVLGCENPAAGPRERRYALPDGHDLVLLDADGLYYLAPLARLVMGVMAPVEQLETAFRTGAGIPYPDFTAHTREGIADLNRPMFLNQLGPEWIGAVPDVHARLSAGSARVADVACGSGWSSIALARAYPGVTVDAIDSDHESIVLARANVEAEGLEDRVRPLLVDASQPDALRGPYDLVTVFEAVHDMAHPVGALSAARAALAPGGSVIVADERVAESFAAPGDEIERLNYGFSVLHCLPVGRSEGHSACTGTVMRPETLERYARAAGFAEVEVLPIEHDFWRFYRLSG